MQRLIQLLAGGDSEFKVFLDLLKDLGIPFSIHWEPTKEEWQNIIIEAGYYITAYACTVVSVGATEYLFSNGQAVWDTRERGYGPRGVYLLSRDTTTKAIINRTFCSSDNYVPSITGVYALKAQYPHYRWPERGAEIAE